MATTPMFSPDGTLGDVPNERVAEATAAGFKPGQELMSPKGIAGVVPVDRVGDALRSGFVPKGAAAVSKPNINVQPGPEGLEADPNNPHPAVGLPGAQPMNRPVTGRDLLPGAIAGGAAALAAAPAVAGPGLIGGLKNAAKAVPTIAAMEGINWARKNMPGGKYIPPGAEWLPVFMGGKPEAAEAEAPAARVPTPTNYKGPYQALAEAVAKTPIPPVSYSVRDLQAKAAAEATGKSVAAAPTTPEEIMADRYQVVNLGGVKTPAAQGASPNLPEMQPSQSTTISQHGYDPAKQQMFITFKNGNTYRYSGVPQEVYNQYAEAESHGSFHANNIKGRYQTDLVSKGKPTAGQQASQALDFVSRIQQQEAQKGIPQQPEKPEGMNPVEQSLWQQGAFGEQPTSDIGAKVRASMPSVPRSKK